MRHISVYTGYSVQIEHCFGVSNAIHMGLWEILSTRVFEVKETTLPEQRNPLHFPLCPFYCVIHLSFLS